MSLDLRPLVSPSYWLSLDPPAVWTGAGRFLAVLFVAMILVAVYVRRARVPGASDRHQAGVERRVAGLLSTMGAVGLLLFFMSFQDIRLFGARFLYLVWLAVTVWWAARIRKFAKNVVPEVRAREQAKREMEKYLPGKRR